MPEEQGEFLYSPTPPIEKFLNLPLQSQYETAERLATKHQLSVAKLFRKLKAINPPLDNLENDINNLYNQDTPNTDVVITNVLDDTPNTDVVITNVLDDIPNTDVVITNVLEDTPNTDVVITNVLEDTPNTDVVITNVLDDIEYLRILNHLITRVRSEIWNLENENGNKNRVLVRLKDKAIEFKNTLEKFKPFLTTTQINNYNNFLEELKTYPITF